MLGVLFGFVFTISSVASCGDIIIGKCTVFLDVNQVGRLALCVVTIGGGGGGGACAIYAFCDSVPVRLRAVR